MDWRWKQAGKAGALAGSVLLLVSLASSKVLLDGFEQAEDQSVRQVAHGARLAFAQRITGLTEKFADWSSWDDMYRFLQPISPRASRVEIARQQREMQAYRAAFVQSNLVPEALSVLGVSLLAIVDLDGHLAWGTGYDLASNRMTPLPREIVERLRPGSKLLQPRGTELVEGLIELPSGLAMLTSRPIIKSDRTGATRGFLIACRALDDEEWSRLRTATGLKLSLLPLDPALNAPSPAPAGGSNALEASLLREMAAGAAGNGASIWAGASAGQDTIAVAALSEDEVAAFSPLRDIDGRLLGALRLAQPRTLRQQGLGTLRLFQWVFWSLGLGAVSLSLFLLRRSEARFRALVQNGWDIVAILRPHAPTYSQAKPQARPQVLGEPAPVETSELEASGAPAVESRLESRLESPQVAYISPAIARVLGRAPGEVERSSVSVWLHPDDRARALEQLGRWMRAPEGSRLPAMSCRWKHKDGSWRDLEMTGVHWPRDPDIAGLVLNARDVSEQKRAQERVLAEVGRFSSLLHSTPEGVLIADSQHRIVASNPAAQQLFGYAEHELANRDINLLLPEPFAAAAPDAAPAAATAPEPGPGNGGTRGGWAPIEVRARRSDGSEFPAELSLARWSSKNEAGAEEEFTAGIVRDISERKQAQARIEESTRRLRASLGEKEVLLKEIHHRVKNNMQVISSILSLQASTLDDPSVRAALRESQGRIKSMALIHEKLYRSDDLARVDFADYLRVLAQDLVRSHPARGARRPLSLDLELSPLRLSIDQAAPCGLLVNELITNALKHAFTQSGPDSPAPQLRLNLSHNEAGETIVQVADNGRGMDPGFNWRESESLGLQLVTTLAEQLEGSIECQANEAVDSMEGQVLAARGTKWQLQFRAREDDLGAVGGSST